jgi:DNA-directed RNA polymerase beta subunit
MCDTVDGTAFSGTSVEVIRDLMEEYQIEDHGYKYLYNGQTGERIKAKIFIVPTFYYRLQKFAISQKYVVDDANKDILSRQPL